VVVSPLLKADSFQACMTGKPEQEGDEEPFLTG